MTILVIHGGAGGDGEWRGLTSLDPERIRCMQNVLQSIGEALQLGSIDALEAVTQAVELMERMYKIENLIITIFFSEKKASTLRPTLLRSGAGKVGRARL